MELYKAIYKKGNGDNLRILGEIYVKNNRNKGFLVIRNKKFHIKDILPNNIIDKDKIKIKMLLSRNIKNNNYMFKDCKTLETLETPETLETLENLDTLENLETLEPISQATIINDKDDYLNEDNNIESMDRISEKEFLSFNILNSSGNSSFQMVENVTTIQKSQETNIEIENFF